MDVQSVRMRFPHAWTSGGRPDVDFLQMKSKKIRYEHSVC